MGPPFQRLHRRATFGWAAGFLLAAFTVSLWAKAPVAGSPGEELGSYATAPDTNYSFRLAATLPGEAETTYILELTSQAWLDASAVDRPVWQHWLSVVIPREVTTTQALLVISGGRNGEPAPDRAPGHLVSVARDTRSVVAEVRQVPNQPLLLAGETKARSEDALIVATWDRFLRTGDAQYPLRLPMTKSVVRAMDAVTAFARTNATTAVKLSGFVLTGASKRGWTTWSTAAVDRRVTAIIPMVFDALNLEEALLHHFGAYGFWAPAIKDYSDARIMDWSGTPEFAALLRIEDPFAHRAQLTMPKFIVNASGDQFFLPDSSRFYFSQLPGTNYLRYVPNADHSLKETDALNSVAAFYQAFLYNHPLPRFDWGFEPDGSIRATAQDPPRQAVLWQAHNPAARDFRADVFGKQWQSTALAAERPGVFVGRVAPPTNGYTAFFVEFTFPARSGAPFKFTTAVRVLPDTLPFEFKPQPPARPAPPSAAARGN
jgi:PhoPQ-activated pathogenicity-related protein